MRKELGRMRHVVLGLVLLFAAACGTPKEEAEPAGQDQAGVAETQAEQAPERAGVIGVSVLTLTNPFFKVIGDAMAEEGAKHGYDVEVVSGDLNPAIQYSQVQDFIVKKVSAIVLTPCDSKAVGTAIKAANDAGIPVFTADIACLAKDVKVVSHIATNNFQGGEQAAQAMIEALDGKGKVAVIDHPEVESAILRVKGFEAGLKNANAAGIEVVGNWPGKGSKDLSFACAQEILQAHPDLNGIFALNDPMALGVVAALEKADKLEQIAVVGFDGMPEGKKAILEGKVYADPIQFPDYIGRETVRAIVRYSQGEEVEPEILIPTRLYYKADAEEDPELKE